MRLSVFGIVTAAAVCGLIQGGCSASTDEQNHLGAGPDPGAKALSGQPEAGLAPASLASMAGTRGVAAVCPPGKAASPALIQAQSLRGIDQRCAQLRQDGEIWQKTRKLAIQNRGDAGARMADLHSPWTRENVAFYIGQCGTGQQRTRTQTLVRIDQKQIGSSCG